MRSIIVLLVLMLYLSYPGKAQKIISGQSQNTQLKLNPQYTRGLPPNLYVEMTFEDDNNNLILEAAEKARLYLTLSNRGKGPAQGLTIYVKDNITDPELIIIDGQEIPFLYPENSFKIMVPINAGFNIQSAEHKLEINIKEHFGYDMDPAFLILNTLKFQEPHLEFAGVQIIDIGDGTAAISIDGKLQAGELIKAKVVIQNVGQNISVNTKYSVISSNNDIYIAEGKGELGNITIGEIKEFWVTISPNKRVLTKEILPIYLSTTNAVSRGNITDLQLPIYLDQRPPDIITLNIKPDVTKLVREVSRFETNSNKITANVGKLIDISQVLPSKTIRTDAVAVIIGLENYSYFAPAPYAENDANIVKEYFKNVLGINNIILYKSKDVTGFFFDNLFDPDFGELQKAVLPGQTDVFVYYSGHGIPNKEGTNIFLLPTDGKAEAIDRQGYDLNKLLQNLDSLKAKSVMLILDACFSGLSRSSQRIETQNLVAMKGVYVRPSKVPEPWVTNPGFTFCSSSSFDQTSLGFDDAQTGLFTYYLCAGLQGYADTDADKKITSGELADYVTAKVKETSVKIRGLQEPQFHGDRNRILAEY